MSINSIKQSVYTSRILKNGLEFAGTKSAAFMSGTALALSCLRPVTILAAPKTDRENRKIACTKSIVSTGINYTVMLGLATLLAKGLKNIEEKPSTYLKPSTIKVLQDGTKPLAASKKYQFASQFFKLGLGLIMAIPKSAMTCALIPPLMDKINKTGNNNHNKYSSNNITFKGGAKLNPISQGVGKVMDKPFMQKMAERFKDSNYPMHIPVISDVLATGSFVFLAKKSKNIPDDKKTFLNNNALISTGLSIGASYLVDKALDKPTEKFIRGFSEANKNSPKLAKYVEGIKIAKPTLIMGGIYYLAIPFVSTILADKIKSQKQA